MALSAGLLESCSLRHREASSSDSEEEGRPGGPRYATDFDEAPRSCLDLLALNRYAEEQKLRLAIRKAAESGAELNHAGYEPGSREEQLKRLRRGDKRPCEALGKWMSSDLRGCVERRPLTLAVRARNVGCPRLLHQTRIVYGIIY